MSDVLGYFPRPFLVKWQENKGYAFCEKVRQDALDVGTLIDAYVYKDICGKSPDNKELILSIGLKTLQQDESKSQQFENCAKAWDNFKQDPQGKEFFAKAVKHKANMQKELVMGDLMGHPDFIFPDELPDLKTSKQISLDHWIQTSQYLKMHLLEECGGDEALAKSTQKDCKISILRLDKLDPNGVWEYKVLGEPFISWCQERFQKRYTKMLDSIKERQIDGDLFNDFEESEFKEMRRKKLQEEKLA